ncbi:MAG TPA: T9SS type A sorting domain-containing protein [Chitinophagaceae bacterium]|nr:T9SS type A sorting domain-containing protein [Chitinophagaceae bacterium]
MLQDRDRWQELRLAGNTAFSIDVQAFAKGTYYLLLHSAGGREVRTFVKR